MIGEQEEDEKIGRDEIIELKALENKFKAIRRCSVQLGATDGSIILPLGDKNKDVFKKPPKTGVDSGTEKSKI